MSDNRKKSKRRRSIDDIPELSSIDKTIAKYLRFQCPTKKGVLMGMQVVYFNGSKAIECLTESKWSSMSSKASTATTESKHPVCFRTKHDVVQTLRRFLDNEMFRRVTKVYKEDKPVKEKNSDSTITSGDTSQSNTPRAVRQRKSKLSTPVTNTETTTTTKDEEKDSSKKVQNIKKKFKFELHEDQQFIDSSNDFYVWIYSPTTIKQYIMGALLVIGCIGVCLFPLWPAEVRTGAYYLSLVLASLLGLLLTLAVVKYIIFAFIWLLTMGKIKFWLLPNLTEDVGFVESFIPLYLLDIATKKKKEIKKDDDENEISNNKEDKNEEKTKSSLASTTTTTVDEPANKEDDEEEEEDEANDDDDKEISTSRSSSVGELDDGSKPQKSSDEDFEVLSKDELETK